MKKILYSSLVASMLLFTACEKDYLEVQPTDAVSSEAIFTTTANAWGAINGMHRSMYFQYSNQDQAGQGSVMINSDALGEDVVMTAQGNGWFNATYQWTMHRNVNAGSLSFIYRYYYKLIANANMIIENIDKAEGPDADKKIIKGQALAYRAWAHHQLVQFFAKRYDAANLQSPGVVLMTKSTTEGQPRATVQEVYTQINKDIDEAIVLLNGYNRGDALKKSHINLNVAKGFKARVALTMQDWATAAKYAAEAREGLSLMTNAQYKEGFNSVTNPEWMWGSYQLDDQQTYFYSFFAYMSANFNSTNIRTNPKAINSKLYDMIPVTDVRKQMWDPTGATVPVPPNGAKKPYANKKFLSKSSSLSVGDVPYMRVAEMYLIEAEAKARLGQADAADVLYTLVKNRDAAAIKSLNTGQALVDEILIQRRIELWGEGFRFLDLKRTNSALDRTGANHSQDLTTAAAMTKPADSKEWEFLIPQAEINANKAITQNEL